MNIIIMSGLPASGKTTKAKQYVDKGYLRISRDDVRLMLGDYSHKSAVEKIVTDICQEALRSAMASGRDIVIDNVHGNVQQVIDNIAKTSIANYNDLMSKVTRVADMRFPEPKIIVDFIVVDVDKAIERDRVRGLNGGRTVGEKVIRDMAKRYPHLVRTKDKNVV